MSENRAGLRRAAAYGALALILVTTGCRTYLDDAAARTPGEVTDDVTILTLLKTRLLRDPDVRGLRIDVDVNKGVVTLSGRVRSEAERQRAVQIAKEIGSVARVVDDLVIRM